MTKKLKVYNYLLLGFSVLYALYYTVLISLEPYGETVSRINDPYIFHQTIVYYNVKGIILTWIILILIFMIPNFIYGFSKWKKKQKGA